MVKVFDPGRLNLSVVEGVDNPPSYRRTVAYHCKQETRSRIYGNGFTCQALPRWMLHLLCDHHMDVGMKSAMFNIIVQLVDQLGFESNIQHVKLPCFRAIVVDGLGVCAARADLKAAHESCRGCMRCVGEVLPGGAAHACSCAGACWRRRWPWATPSWPQDSPQHLCCRCPRGRPRRRSAARRAGLPLSALRRWVARRTWRVTGPRARERGCARGCR